MLQGRTPAQVAVQAVAAGCDQLLMPGDPGVAYHALLRAVRHGRISLAQLDASVARIVSLKLARGLASEPAAAPSAAADHADTSRQRDLARELANRSITVVANDRESASGVRHEDRYLPLRSKRVYVAGPAAAGLTAALQPELAATGGQIVASPAQADVIVAATRDAVNDAAQQRLVRGLVAVGPACAGAGHRAALRPGPVSRDAGRGRELLRQRRLAERGRRGTDRTAASGGPGCRWPSRPQPGARRSPTARACRTELGRTAFAVLGPGLRNQPAGWRQPGALTIGSVFDPQLTSHPTQPGEETAPATGAGPAPGQPLRGVIADWGGVMTNPIAETVRAWIAADEIEYTSYHAVMKAWVTGAYDVAGEDNPIHVLERGECSDEEFEQMLAAQIVRRDGNPVTAAGLLNRMFAATVLSEPMLDLLRRVRAAGLKTAMLSNSWGVGIYPADVLAELFDAVVISAEVGMRKPEERIFRHAAGLLGLDPAQCVFIDDIEANVQAAEALGMTGVLHTDPAATAGRLAELLDLS